MAIEYSGNLPRIRGRNVNDLVNPYKGVGVYSNWSIYDGRGPLSDMPETEDHVPGTGRYPHNLQLSRRLEGLDTDTPLDDPGLGPVLTWYRKYSDALLKMGEDGQDVFPDGFGHERRITSYSEWDHYIYRGVTPTPFHDPGHPIRGLNDPGTANWFGATHPYIYKGVSETPLDDPGETIEDKPTGDEFAFKRIKEWKGVPSAQAL